MDEAQLKRIPPSDVDAEKSVIGEMIISRDAIYIANDILCADDFYSKQNGILFDAIVTLNDEGKPADVLNLKNKLKEMGISEDLVNLEYIKEIIANVFTTTNIRSHCETVADKSLRRRMIKLNQEIENMCYVDSEKSGDILALAEKKVFDISSKRNVGEFVPIRKVVKNAIDKIAQAARTSGSVTGVATGFTELDYRTAGLQPSDLILVAARPSMGKTAFVLNIAQHVCFKDNKAAVIFSLEMSKEQLVNRLLSLESHVDSKKIRNGNVGAQEWEGLIEGASTIGESDLIIDDTPGISISELVAKCRKYKIENDIQLVIIDYLQLMSGSGKSYESKANEVGDISRALKALARDINVPVIALSQLSRSPEKRDDHRPMLSDLRDSGAIEQDADVVMFLYRDDYYNHETEKKNIAEVIIAKQRNGPIGTVELVWIPDLTKFGNMEKKL